MAAGRRRFRRKQHIGEAVICCVDSISARAAIWKAVQNRCKFWADGRMLGEVIRILGVADEEGWAHYPTTLFDESEAQPGRCTARSTIYTAILHDISDRKQTEKMLRENADKLSADDKAKHQKTA
jgi:hypothetical protein